MRRLAWIASIVVLSACATADPARETALLRDARECEEDADNQLRSAGQVDHGLRLLFFKACMTLRGWSSQ